MTWEVIFENGSKQKTVRVNATDFDNALRKLKENGYDYSSYDKWGTEDIISFKKVDFPEIEVIN